MRHFRFALLAIPLILAGCLSDADRIKRRIDSKPEVFQQYAEETRQRLERGELRVGDDKNAAWFVYGQPTRTSTRITAAGTSEIWVYTVQAIQDNFPEPRLVSYPVRTSTGRTIYLNDYYYMDGTTLTEVEALRVEFQNGKVAAIEATDPN